MKRKIHCAVIGAGYFGKFHIEKYLQIPQAKLIGFADSNPQICHHLSRLYDIESYLNYHSLIDKVEAVSIATPINIFFPIAKTFLEHGIHVLLEKPMGNNLSEAEILMELAEKNKCILQIGYIENFNPIVAAFKKYKPIPQKITSKRFCQLQTRNQNSNIVLDLMTHDIYFILSIVSSPITNIAAHFINDHNVIGQIQFANGCEAHLNVQRTNKKTERKTVVMQENGMFTLDFQNSTLTIEDKGQEKIIQFPSQDILFNEIKSFVEAIANGKKPLISAMMGAKTLAVALQINAAITQQTPIDFIEPVF